MKSKYVFLKLVGGVVVAVLMVIPVAGQSAKAPHMTDKEVVALVQSAKTAADHERLAGYYEETATDLAEKAKTHKELAAAYRRMPAPGNPRLAKPAMPIAHCENIAASAAKAAEEARTMAAHHKMLAKDASTTGK